jgi:aerobic carbon-monoxide dehydrogenase medium subunit
MSLHPMYARPRDLEQASQLLASLSSGAVIIAGGQEIMPFINYGVMMPDVYVDIGGIKALRGVNVAADEVSIGALTVHRDIQSTEEIVERLPLLAYAAQQIGGGWQVHNRGTIGGNVVAMHPLYDIAPALLALNADVELLSDKGLQRLSLLQLQNDSSYGLGSSSILTRILVETMSPNALWGYYKLKNTAGAYGSANAAVVIKMDGAKITSVRIVIGAVSEKLVVISESLDGCLGSPYTLEIGQAIEKACIDAIDEPLSDQQGDGVWRKAMAGVAARRATEMALRNLTNSSIKR